MAIPDDSLPANVLDAIRGGNKVEAIKRLRQSTGLGLAEAKDLVDTHVRRAGRPASDTPSLTNALPAVAEAIERGNVIEAIRLLRTQGGIGLKEAKDAVERARQPDAQSNNGPSDTFDRAINMLWWVLALVLGGLVVYYFMSKPG